MMQWDSNMNILFKIIYIYKITLIIVHNNFITYKKHRDSGTCTQEHSTLNFGVIIHNTNFKEVTMKCHLFDLLKLFSSSLKTTKYKH